MMVYKRIIGFFPYRQSSLIPSGGQETAGNGIKNFIERNHIPSQLINSSPTIEVKNNMAAKIMLRLKKILSVISAISFCKNSVFLAFNSTFHGTFFRFLLALYCKIWRVPSALFLRNSLILDILPGSFKSQIIRIYFSPFSVFLVQGEVFKRHLIFLGISEHKIHVIPNWLSEDFSIKSTPTDINKSKIHFIFTGRVAESKGVFEILSATEMLKDKYDFDVSIVGDGADFVKIQEIISKNKLYNIYLRGWMSGFELNNLLKESHVLLLPTHHPEGLPNSIIEAMANGLAIIATDKGAIVESVYHSLNGFIVESSSAFSLAMSMEKYLINNDLINQHSRKSLELVQKRHNYEINCKQLLSVLNKI